MKMYSVCLPKQKVELEVFRVANVQLGCYLYQGLINGKVFTENKDYSKVSMRVNTAVQLNTPSLRGN